MKKITLLITIFLFLSVTLFAQEKEENEPEDNDNGITFNYKIKGKFGGTTVDGKNYQQIGLQPELYIGKFGLALDINVLLDEEGNVREEDWDESKDYIDLIHFISWGKKGEPFYAKIGGLNSTYMGYRILLNGYTNLLEYPTYKKHGLDMAIDTNHVEAEFIVNDFREAFVDDTAGFMGGARLCVKPFGRIKIAASFAGDLNEYNGFHDDDGDGYPDEIDKYPNDSDYATEYDYYAANAGPATAESLVSSGLISPLRSSDLENFSDKTSKTGFWAGDIAFSVIKTKNTDLDIYSQYAQCLNTGGWGMSLPGVRFRSGWLTLYAEYKQNSDEFIFGYYNNTYDLERAKYVEDGSGNLYAVTKKEKLEEAQAGRGYLAGISMDIFGILIFNTSYQDLKGDVNDRSFTAELTVNPKIIPKVVQTRAYFTQNNVEKIEWKTESTVMGASLKMDFKAAKVEFSYMVTYEDINGNGEIDASDETIKNVQIVTSTIF